MFDVVSLAQARKRQICGLSIVFPARVPTVASSIMVSRSCRVPTRKLQLSAKTPCVIRFTVTHVSRSSFELVAPSWFSPLLAPRHQQEICDHRSLPFPPCLVDQSKPAPPVFVTWKQASYLPPTCSLKTAVTNKGHSVESLLQIQGGYVQLQVIKHRACAVQCQKLSVVEISSALWPSSRPVCRCLGCPRR